MDASFLRDVTDFPNAVDGLLQFGLRLLNPVATIDDERHNAQDYPGGNHTDQNNIRGCDNNVRRCINGADTESRTHKHTKRFVLRGNG